MCLNGGIQDALNLSEKLAEVWHGRADASLLDLYDLQRRTITTEFVQAQTVRNKKRLETKDEAIRQANFRELRETQADPARPKAFLMRSSMLDAAPGRLSARGVRMEPTEETPATHDHVQPSGWAGAVNPTMI